MTKGDKELIFWLAVFIAAMLFLIWLMRRGMEAGGIMMPAFNPYTTTVPGFQDTVDVTGGTYNINVPSTPLAWIAPYFPLFGFVGIDATQIYQ